MRKLIVCGLLFALALRSSSSSSTTTVASNTSRTSSANDGPVGAHETKTAIVEPESATGRGQNVTEHAVDDEGRAAVDSGERETEDDAAPDDEASRVSELYEDIEDSVVFEDSEAGGETPVASAGGGRLLDGLQHLPIDNGRALVPAAAATTDDEYSAATASAEEEYDGVGGGRYEDAATAGTSPVQRSIRFPDYVRSSSYRRGWPGGNVTRPEELFRFWDPYEWTPAPGISARCAEHMERYKEGLRNGNMWAYKSEYLQMSRVRRNKRVYNHLACILFNSLRTYFRNQNQRSEIITKKRPYKINNNNNITLHEKMYRWCRQSCRCCYRIKWPFITHPITVTIVMVFYVRCVIGCVIRKSCFRR